MKWTYTKVPPCNHPVFVLVENRLLRDITPIMREVTIGWYHEGWHIINDIEGIVVIAWREIDYPTIPSELS